MDLGSYEAAKFELAQVLRALTALTPKGSSAVKQGATDLFARLAEDRFNLLVVGRFSRGKSSLMNAILGMDRLPTGLLPLTSVITSVTYGSQERVWIIPEGGGLEFDIALEKLPEYVTERGNPGNTRRVRMAQISLPAEILRRGFYFVDSPGLGSAIAANTLTTRAFLPEADAVMLVSGYEGPLSEEEQQIVRVLDGSHRQLFFVLNKQDTVPPEARLAVRDYVQQRLAQIWSGEALRIFSISARDALKAKLAGQADELRASGLPDLEHELTRFLVEDRGRAFLAGMASRISQLVNSCPLSLEQLAPLRTRLAAFGAHRAASLAWPGTANRDSTLSVTPNEGVRIAECVLCARISDALFEYLCQYQHNLAVHAEAAERFAASGGLCAVHLRQYVSLATDRDVCVALTPLMKHLAEALRDGSHGALISTRATCALCALQASVESAAFDEWSRGAVAPAPMMCLLHLRKWATRGPEQARIKAQSQHYAAAVERLAEDMQRYVLKRDGIRRGLTTDEETQAAQSAVAFVAGLRTILDDR